MRKDLIYVVILLLLLLPTQILMVRGYKSLDGAIHTARIEQFHEAIKLGQIPVRLAPSLMGQIGYPLFVVNYQLPYYLAEIFMDLNNNPQFAYKSVMAMSFILGGVFAFLLFKKIGSNISALTGALVFSYMPYRFGDLYMRGALGESVSVAFVPLIFLSLHKIRENNKLGTVLLAVSTFGLITSHTAIFAIFAPIIAFYSLLILKHNKSQTIRIILGLTLGFMLSSFQLLPSIFEKSYMRFDENVGDIYKDQFVDIYQLLRIPKQGINLGTYFQIGIVSSLIAIIGFILMVFKKSFYLLFFLTIFAMSIFFTTGLSKVVWDNFKPLTYVIYPYRFIIVTIFVSALVSVYIVENVRLKVPIAIILICLTIYTNRHFLKIAPWYEIPPSKNLTTLDENNPIWSNNESFKERALVTVSDDYNISQIINTPYFVSFNIQNHKTTEVTIRKLYFPGWQLKVNDQLYSIQINEGLITFLAQEGTSRVSLKYKETPLRYFSNMLTVLAFGVLLTLIITFYKKRDI